MNELMFRFLDDHTVVCAGATRKGALGLGEACKNDKTSQFKEGIFLVNFHT